MKYDATYVGRSDYRDLFAKGRVYDDRQIAAVAAKKHLRLTRPHGRLPYRGSRRLELADPKTRKVLWEFSMSIEEDRPTKVLPVPFSVPGL